MRSAKSYLRKRRLQRAMTSVLSEPKVYEETRNYNISHVGPSTLDGAAFQGGKQSWMADALPTIAQMAVMYKLGIASTLAASMATTGPTRKVYVDRMLATYTLRNNFNQDCEVRMYLLWPRSDISYQQYRNSSGATPTVVDPFTLLTNLTTTGGAATPVVALNNLWPRDPDPDAALAPNAIRDYHYEWNPYKDSWFATFTKIKRLATFRLRPGESREWTYKHRPFMVSKAKLGLGYGQNFDDVLSGGVTMDKTLLRGHPIVLIGVRGTIVHNQTALPAVNNASGYGFACYNTGDGLNAFGQVPGDFNVDGVVHRVWRVRRVVEQASGTFQRSSGDPIGLFAQNSGPSAILKQWAEVAPGEQTGGA